MAVKFPSVIEPADVRVGDLVRVATRDSDVEILETILVAEIVNAAQFRSAMGVSVDIWADSVVYLLQRPETSPEVEAIAKALGVSYDAACDYHSRGVVIRD